MNNFKNYITTPLPKFEVLTELDARKELEFVSEKFIKFSKRLIEINDVKKINMIGIGNSIESGWSAINNNVQPIINKLEDFIAEKAYKSNVSLGLHSYCIMAHNSNREIYELLIKDPTQKEIAQLFNLHFDEWKTTFNDTLFENYVDKEIALSFYPSNNIKLSDLFDKDTLTISHVSANTGGVLEDIFGYLTSPKKRNAIHTLELKYLKLIVTLLKEKSDKSIVSVSNFPFISTPSGILVNKHIEKFNQKIKNSISEDALFYQKATIAFIQMFQNKLKIDNHPSIDEQYTFLFNYLNFLMIELTSQYMKESFTYLTEDRSDKDNLCLQRALDNYYSLRSLLD